ncbi:MAG: helicase associated domain-containing protein [Flavobacteriaceae bacterium]|nr:helicase associated domain-containing protein [Flavobacteriaceae bacterium]MCY4266595.1 helicase associated domain-containing protein [Flavobacteriaceae bacterium]MCY4297978.1 helicase associated domain-containing protein [Flavobacteriaceae bacterium]
MKKKQKLSSIELLTLEMSQLQEEVLQFYVQFHLKKLEKRTRNAFKSIVGDDFSAKNIIYYCLPSEKIDINTVKNVGKSTAPKLKSFIESYEEYLAKIYRLKNKELIKAHRNRYVLGLAFKNHDFPLQLLIKDSVFQIVQYLLKNKLLFDTMKQEVYLNSYEIYSESKQMNIHELAKKFHLTTERVRQVKLSFKENLKNGLSVLKKVEEDFKSKYGIDTESSIIDITAEQYVQINQKNNTQFSNKFIQMVLGYCLSHKVNMVGEFYDVFKFRVSKSRKRHNWKNIYLIQNLMTQSVDFVALVDALHNEAIKKHVVNKRIPYFTFVDQFIQPYKLVQTELIHQTVKKILLEEFEEIMMDEESIIIKRNSLVLYHEFCSHALESIGRPAHVQEIKKKLDELYPEKEFQIGQIRSSLKRMHGFIPIGRSSVFAFQKWEGKMENFKGGTIREIVIEYLNQHSEPISLKQITQYVLQYRPKTSKSSISTNLRLKVPNPFIFYRGGFIGLESKVYSMKYEVLKLSHSIKREDWYSVYNRLVAYLEVHNHFPAPSKVSKHQVKLYNWYILQKKYCAENKLPKEKCHLISQLIQKYPRFDYRSFKKIAVS